MSLLTGLHWWWDLAATGATITDQVNGLVLTRNGTVTTDASGGPGGGGCCDFGNSLGSFSNASVARPFNYGLGVSVNIWFNVTSTAVNQWLINHRAGVPNAIHFQSLIQTGNYFTAVTSSVGTGAAVGPLSVPSLNAWHMLTFTDDGTTMTAYLNGVSAGTASTAGLGVRSALAAPFAIGTSSWDLNFARVKGKLAMAGVWSAVLTGANVTSLYNSGAGKRYAELATSPTQRRQSAQQSIQGVI